MSDDNSESINIDDYVVVNTPLDQEMSQSEDVSVAKDGGILKEILRAAPDDARGPPFEGAVVTVHYVVSKCLDKCSSLAIDIFKPIFIHGFLITLNTKISHCL